MADHGTSRRTFLKTAAVTSGALAVPYFVPKRAFGANERIVTAHIGVGGMGRNNLRGQIDRAAALCDVEQKHLDQAAKMCTDKGKKVDLYTDFRRILDRDDIDAVFVCTPDHWHAPISIAACQAGKDVYCEKPMTLTIPEGRAMVKAARENKRVLQNGSQQRSASNFRRACELVRNGAIGDVHTVLVGISGANHPGKLGPDGDPPSTLDYNFWLGPAPTRPYNSKRVHYNFRFWRDYSGGQQTNWGAHHLDIAQWGLGMDESGPKSVTCISATIGEHHEVTEKCRIEYEYEGGIKLLLGQGERDIPQGTTFIGSKGKIHVNRGKLEADPKEILDTELGSDAIRLYESRSHHGNFLDCIKSRELPICDVEVGHRSSTVCHLANLAVDAGEGVKLVWDPVAEKFVGNEQANEMLSRPQRDWRNVIQTARAN